MTIERFQGGSASAREKLNRLVDEANALANLRGDEQFIVVRRGPSGVTVALNINNVLARIPKYVPGVGAGAVTLGIVCGPGTNGQGATSYTVNVYGTDWASLQQPPTQLGVTALQVPMVAAYYWGELVGLQFIDGRWYTQKFLTTQLAYQVGTEAKPGPAAAPGQVCVRMFPPDAGFGNTDNLTNFMVDLYDCLTFFDAGRNAVPAHVAFNWGGYGGIGDIRPDRSVAMLYQEAWRLVHDATLHADSAGAVAAVITQAPTSIATSQDTLAIPAGPMPTGLAGAWAATTRSVTYTLLDGYSAGETLTVTEVNGAVSYTFQSPLAASGYPGLPSLPALGFNNDKTALLLGRYTASIGSVWNYDSPPYRTPNGGVLPNVSGTAPVLFGQSPAGTYSGLSYAYPFTHTTGLTVS